MIKKLLFITFLSIASLFASAQTFSLIYPFSSVTATSGTVDPTPAPTGTGVISGSFTAVGLSANPTTSNVFAFQSWPAGATPSSNVTFTGSLDPTKYFEIVVTPSVSYVVSLSSMYFYMNRSATGARHWAVRSNKDGYTASLPAVSLGVGTGSTIVVENGNTFFWSDWQVTTTTSNIGNDLCKINFSGANFTDQFSAYRLRIHAWDGTSTSGSWRIDSVAINGTSTYSLGAGLPNLTHDLNAQFKLYPNPSSDGVVMLESTKNNFSKVEVINILGSVVAVQSGILADKIKLDLTSIPEGTYFVRITSGEKVTNEKLIIAK